MSSGFVDNVLDDPKDVDTLLSRELMGLSLNDRNAINEEIHGVNCRSPEETPELLERSLNLLDFELNHGLTPEESFAYRESQQFPHTIVNTLDFRLRFLRCELFDAKKAAKRMAFILNTTLELFGPYSLERHVRLNDFTKQELKYMRKGRFQWLPFRDRSGRRIIVMFPGKESSNIPARIKAKIVFYKLWTAGNDPDTQRKGIVVLIWLDKSSQMMLYPMENKPRLHEISSVRICAIHGCTPDTPMYKFWRAVFTMRSAHNRVHLRMHAGSTVELSYILQGYGIPTETIPITFSGTVKVQAIKQWMRLRAYLEEPIYQNSAELESIVECPYNTDIVFRQGTSILAHVGNQSFRGLIVSKYDEFERMGFNCIDTPVHNDDSSKNTKKNQKSKDILGTRILVEEVIEEMQRTNRRVLNWSDRPGCFKVLANDGQIYVKVEYLVRDHKNLVKAQKNQQLSQSSTSVFCRKTPEGCFGNKSFS